MPIEGLVLYFVALYDHSIIRGSFGVFFDSHRGSYYLIIIVMIGKTVLSLMTNPTIAGGERYTCVLCFKTLAGT